MIPKATVALAVVLAALTAMVRADATGAARARLTIAFVTSGIDTPGVQAVASGGRAAAKALGMRYVLAGPHGNGANAIPFYKSMIARHVNAIVSDGYNPPLTPIFTKVRKAGILLVSSGDDIAATRDLWVSLAGPVDYAHALADALASQTRGSGEYAILEEQDEYPVADTWAKLAKAYIAKTYPNMKLEGILRGTGAGDQTEVDTVKAFMAGHPNLAGLLAVTPTEAYMAADAIGQAGRIGQVFSAGIGGITFGDPEEIDFVRKGAAALVFGGDPRKLGYLTVWGAHYLLSGRRLRTGAYQVGGPIGLVWYYAKNRELRLGQPLTITKTNVDLYANTF